MFLPRCPRGHFSQVSGLRQKAYNGEETYRATGMELKVGMTFVAGKQTFKTDGTHEQSIQTGLLNLGGKISLESKSPSGGEIPSNGPDRIRIHSPEWTTVQLHTKTRHIPDGPVSAVKIRAGNIAYRLERDELQSSRAEGALVSLGETAVSTSIPIGKSSQFELCAAVDILKAMIGRNEIQGDRDWLRFENSLQACGAIQVGKEGLRNTISASETYLATLAQPAESRSLANTTRLDFVSDDNLKLDLGYTVASQRSRNGAASEDSRLVTHTVSLGVGF